MKNIKNVDLTDKKVLIRSDFNVPIEDGIIQDDKRIKAAVETIKEAIRKKPKFLMIVSHLGRPDGEYKKEFSLKPVKKELEKIIGEKFELLEKIEELGKAKENEAGSFILENIRFWPEEQSNDEQFSKSVAEGFDIYVNDAFSSSHRNHASIVGFPTFAKEKVAGLLFEKEYKKLSQVRDNPKSPAVAIIGGAKIETKLPVIENLREKYNFILVGGLIANEALDQHLDLGDNVFLPIDFSPETLIVQRLDIGPETIKVFKEKISKAKTIVWNGPMGKFEDLEAEKGTKEIMKAVVAKKEAEQVIGGGETLEAVERFGNFSDFDYVSMSGGAMLEFLSGKELPGIKALE